MLLRKYGNRLDEMIVFFESGLQKRGRQPGECAETDRMRKGLGEIGSQNHLRFEK